MSCYGPITLKQKDKYVTVPCGRCIGCLQDKRAEWSFRLFQELKVSETAQFVTLTYEDENLLYNEHSQGCLYKPDLQAFIKSLRKREKGHKIRYYAVGEYGSKTNRPHYHLILFNCHNIANIDKSWGLGHVQVGSVTPASIHYVTKYVINRFDPISESLPPQFATMSRRPGIGHEYLANTTEYHRKNPIAKVNYNGITIKMPRFYKEKIYNKYQLEDIGIRALEANTEREKIKLKKALEKGENYDQKILEIKKAKEHLARKYSKCKF